MCAHGQCCALEAELRSRSCHCDGGKCSGGAAPAEWRHHGSGMLCALPLTSAGSQPSACPCAAASRAAAPCCNLQGQPPRLLGPPSIAEAETKGRAHTLQGQETGRWRSQHASFAQREGCTRNATPQPHPVLPAQLLLPAAGTQSPEPLCLCLLLIMRCKSGAACNQRQ